MQEIPMTFQNGLQLPAVQPCYWVGFRISLSREGAIFRDEIENYFSCSRLARRDRDYHMTILVFRDENEIPFCYSHVSRRDQDFRKSFLVVEREKIKLTLVENSRDREFSLTSVLGPLKSVLAFFCHFRPRFYKAFFSKWIFSRFKKIVQCVL